MMTINNRPEYGRLGHIIRLSWALALAKFRLRIAGRYLGILWYILEPLVFFLILLSLQGSTGGNSIDRYPAYLLLGLIMINFFIGATTGAVKSVRESKYLVQSISIDQEVLPFSTVVQFCFSHAFEIILFAAISVCYGLFSWTILWYPIIFAVYAMFVLGVSFLIAVLGVFIEDLDNIWTVGSRLLWLGTPIFYNVAPGSVLFTINRLNPVYRFIDISRDVVVYNIAPSMASVLAVLAFAFVALAIGLPMFLKFKRRFGEFL